MKGINLLKFFLIYVCLIFLIFSFATFQVFACGGPGGGCTTSSEPRNEFTRGDCCSSPGNLVCDGADAYGSGGTCTDEANICKTGSGCSSTYGATDPQGNCCTNYQCNGTDNFGQNGTCKSIASTCKQKGDKTCTIPYGSSGIQQGDCCPNQNLICNGTDNFGQNGTCIDKNTVCIAKSAKGCTIPYGSTGLQQGTCCDNQNLICNGTDNFGQNGTCIDKNTVCVKQDQKSCTIPYGSTGEQQGTCCDNLICNGTDNFGQNGTCKPNVPELPSPTQQGQEGDTPQPNPCQKNICPTAIGNIDVSSGQALVTKIFQMILSLAGGIALTLIIYSGYQIAISDGNPEKVKGAKETIFSAIVGLLFIIFSIAILQIIGVDILQLPGYSR